MVRQPAKHGDLRLHIAAVEPGHADLGPWFAEALLLAGIPICVMTGDEYANATEMHRHFPGPDVI